MALSLRPATIDAPRAIAFTGACGYFCTYGYCYVKPNHECESRKREQAPDPYCRDRGIAS